MNKHLVYLRKHDNTDFNLWAMIGNDRYITPYTDGFFFRNAKKALGYKADGKRSR